MRKLVQKRSCKFFRIARVIRDDLAKLRVVISLGKFVFWRSKRSIALETVSRAENQYVRRLFYRGWQNLREFSESLCDISAPRFREFVRKICFNAYRCGFKTAALRQYRGVDAKFARLACIACAFFYVRVVNNFAVVGSFRVITDSFCALVCSIFAAINRNIVVCLRTLATREKNKNEAAKRNKDLRA